MLDKNYLGHDLVEKNHPIKDIEEYYCNKCKIIIWDNSYHQLRSNNKGVVGIYYYSEYGWLEIISCDEMIIKQIIE
jgi:hypothetical protein